MQIEFSSRIAMIVLSIWIALIGLWLISTLYVVTISLGILYILLGLFGAYAAYHKKVQWIKIYAYIFMALLLFNIVTIIMDIFQLYFFFDIHSAITGAIFSFLNVVVALHAASTM